MNNRVRTSRTWSHQQPARALVHHSFVRVERQAKANKRSEIRAEKNTREEHLDTCQDYLKTPEIKQQQPLLYNRNRANLSPCDNWNLSVRVVRRDAHHLYRSAPHTEKNDRMIFQFLGSPTISHAQYMRQIAQEENKLASYQRGVV